MIPFVMSAVLAAALPAAFNFPSGPRAKVLLEVQKTDGTKAALETTRRSPGVLTVDGISTGFAWDGSPLDPWPLADGRLVLASTYSRRVVLLWNAKLARLTDLGDQVLLSVGRLLVFLLRSYDKPGVTLSDVDPHADRLRPLWKSATATWLYSLSARASGLRALACDRGLKNCSIVTLLPAHTTTAIQSSRLQALLESGFQPIRDGFRDERLLLLRSEAWPRERRPLWADAAIFDLATSQVRELGRFPGGWGATDGLHPTFVLSWENASPLQAQSWWEKDEQCAARVESIVAGAPAVCVMEDTEQLVVHDRR